jgi:hypothetical protein
MMIQERLVPYWELRELSPDWQPYQWEVAYWDYGYKYGSSSELVRASVSNFEHLGNAKAFLERQLNKL